MKDIAPELLEAVEKTFKESYENSNSIKKILLKIESQNATYKEVNAYAEEVGDLLVNAFQKVLSSDVLPEGKMYYNIAQRVIGIPMENNFKLVSKACEIVQTDMNKKADIGLKGIPPDLNKSRIKGLVDVVSNDDNFDKVKSYIDEPVVNFTQSIVDDSIKVNAEFQYKSGLSPKIKRISTGHCCDWCEKLAGTYNYADTPKDVFRRHRFCRCTVEYIANGKKENVHTKKDTTRESRIQQIKDLEELDKEKGRIRKQTVQKEQKQKKKTKPEPKLEAMSLTQLREKAEKVAIQYYKSGKSGISFGKSSVEHAAKVLAQQGSRTSLIKDIRSMEKALR